MVEVPEVLSVKAAGKKVISKVKREIMSLSSSGTMMKKLIPPAIPIPEPPSDDHLRRYVNETRAKGGIPVLFNSIVRRKFCSA